MTRRDLIATPVSYDQVPYPSLSYSQSHPDRMATIATLLGLSPPPVERCRVLELGCAGGGNLVPMAYALPESEFVGIDLSARQIAEGQRVIDTLALRNIELRQMDILDVDAGLGQYDYIIAHGVYTWVPEQVRDKILQSCRENLVANGLCYVSYNTYPGWHMMNIVRDMMLYHTREIVEPERRAARAHSFVNFLVEAGPGEDSAYGSYIKSYAQMLDGKLEEGQARDHSLLLHDELEVDNEPVYFYQFADRASRFGLQFLAEADFSDAMRSKVPRKVREAVDDLATSLVELEQYMDFLQNRTFRQSLLCREEIKVSRDLKPKRVTGLRAASRAEPVASEPDIHTVSVEQFRGHDNAILSTDHPVSKAAMLCLAQVWPRPVPFAGLLAAAHARLDHPTAQGENSSALRSDDSDVDALVLASNLVRAYGYSDSLVDLYSHEPPIACEDSERPVASAVVRYQAQGGHRVTNLCHQRVTLDEFERYLVLHLDGGHDRDALVDRLLEGPVAQGLLTAQPKVEQVRGSTNVESSRVPAGTREDGLPEDMPGLLAEEVDRKLGALARAALLVG